MRHDVVFRLTVLVTIVIFGLLGVILVWPELVAAIFGPNLVGHISQHFRLPEHRIHDLTFSLLMGSAAIGLVVQLRNPVSNVAGQLMSLTTWIMLTVVAALTGSWVFAPAPILGGLTLLATTLHPAGSGLRRALTSTRLSRPLLALVAVAAVPLLGFSIANIGLQRNAANDHAALGHYGFMASFGLTVIGFGVLASLRPSGWRLVAWVVGCLSSLLGLASILLPGLDSSLALISAGAAVVWGFGFVAAAEFVLHSTPNNGEEPVSDSDPGISSQPKSEPSRRGPNWGLVLAVVVLAVGLLVGVLHLTGGGPGPGLHQPPVQHGIQQP